MQQKTKAALLAIAVTLSLSGCVVEPVHPRRPPPPVEVVPVMPAPGAQWVPGHYHWAGNAWLWSPGHWRRY